MCKSFLLFKIDDSKITKEVIEKRNKVRLIMREEINKKWKDSIKYKIDKMMVKND